MGHIEIKNRNGNNYAYYVSRNDEGERKTEYVGPISNKKEGGVICSRCGKSISEEEVKEAIINQLNKVKEDMKKDNRHIKEYSQYRLLSELIEAFTHDFSE